MLEVTKEQKDKTLFVNLSGVVDDDTDLEKLIGPPPGELSINCSKVARINSVGVKGWIKYFQKAQLKGTKLKFIDVSPALIHQINMVCNFTCGGTVESLQVSYACPGCNNIFTETVDAKMIKKQNFEVPDRRCPKCGGTASFDDFAEEYFSFLMNK